MKRYASNKLLRKKGDDVLFNIVFVVLTYQVTSMDAQVLSIGT